MRKCNSCKNDLEIIHAWSYDFTEERRLEYGDIELCRKCNFAWSINSNNVKVIDIRPQSYFAFIKEKIFNLLK